MSFARFLKRKLKRNAPRLLVGIIAMIMIRADTIISQDWSIIIVFLGFVILGALIAG